MKSNNWMVAGLLCALLGWNQVAFGRYAQSDPIGQGDGPSTYSYVHSRPLFTYDPFGLATFRGFPPDKQKQMENAVNQAVQTMQNCKGCTDCGENNMYNGWCINKAVQALVVQSISDAEYEYVPKPPQIAGSSDHPCAINVNSNYVRVYPGALAGECCSLPSTLAHEAGHIAGLGHQQIFFYEERCFGCQKNWGSTSP